LVSRDRRAAVPKGKSSSEKGPTVSGTVKLGELHGDEYLEARVHTELKHASEVTTNANVLREYERALRSLIEAERGLSRTGFAALQQRRALKSRYSAARS
jgi:hypothetical protein